MIGFVVFSFFSLYGGNFNYVINKSNNYSYLLFNSVFFNEFFD